MNTNSNEIEMDTETIKWNSKYESWYPSPVISKNTYIYLKMIETVFHVKYPDGSFKNIQLTNHQAEFHSNDLAIKKYDANSEVYIKSRNTSFTTNEVIRILTSTYDFQNQRVPATRINDKKVMELIQTEFKEIIQHMKPIKFPTYDAQGKEIQGIYDYWPFNPNNVEFTAHEIRILDRNVIITGYPANSSASESIRGLRINYGLQDETNFMLEFQNLDVAMTDAARGAEIDGPNKGRRAFQVTYGTTRKGRFTNFNRWYENIEKLTTLAPNEVKIKIHKWPVFDPKTVDLEKSFFKQPHLIPIVPWHTIEHLEERRRQNLNAFKEEYMCMLVDEKGKLYDMQFILDNLLQHKNTQNELYNNIKGKWRIGIDPAYINDYFSISIFNAESNEDATKEIYKQYGLYYETNLDPMEIQEKCEDIISHYITNDLGLDAVFIDGNGPGVPLSKHLYKIFPQYVKVVRTDRIKMKKMSIPIKEYLHTNQIDLQYQQRVKYLSDDIQMMHFSGWKNDYNFDKSHEDTDDFFIGHGDTTISNGLALLPKNFNLLSDNNKTYIGNLLVRYDKIHGKDKDSDGDTETGDSTSSNSSSDSQMTLEQRLQWYKSPKNKKGGLWWK